jgi:Tfp pilus assembly protein PilE
MTVLIYLALAIGLLLCGIALFVELRGPSPGDLISKVMTAPKQVAVIVVVVLILLVVGYIAYQHNVDREVRLQQATVLTAAQAQDINVLQNELKINKQNAESTAKALTEALNGQRQPEVKFIVQAPTVQAAADKVAEQINQQDKTLPPLALEKTDRTLVVPNETKTPEANWDVGVFKVNNYRNWEWSSGYGQHKGEGYIPIGLQRNYSKDKAIEAEIHQDAGDVKKNVGWEVKYVISTDKLLFLF